MSDKRNWSFYQLARAIKTCFMGVLILQKSTITNSVGIQNIHYGLKKKLNLIIVFNDRYENKESISFFVEKDTNISFFSTGN